MPALDQLKEIRDYSGEPATVGLPDTAIEEFAASDTELAMAISEAHARHMGLRDEWGEALRRDERDLVHWIQSDYVNFYSDETVNPYVALAARGPWLVTAHGAVLHDNGGYGMLGMGHAPEDVLDTMVRPWVMANVMTPSLSQKRLGNRLRAEIGQTLDTGCPYERFICMNSGSEAVTVAMRIADVHALRETGPGGSRPDAPVKFIGLRGAFHGRTDRPAQVSDSSLPKYRANLHSFQHRDNLIVAEPNNVESLRAAFEQADEEGVFVAAMFFEPVMGEGNPGESVTREFYEEARALCTGHGTLLIADSIQAGIRGTGYLSFVDYPGFEGVQSPDMETWSKAMNAGQYPMSVLGLNERAAALYVRGIYGNTMTTNPRALEVACTVLDALTPELRANIRERGAELLEKIGALKPEFPGLITKVQGTGLLLSCEVDPERAQVVGFDGLETWCRRHGLGVIHGGKNALRFTPHFAITSAEVDLIVSLLRECFQAVLSSEALQDTVSEKAASELRA